MSTYKSVRAQRVYNVIVEHFSGDRVEALKLWVKLYKYADPITALNEDQECVSAAKLSNFIEEKA